MDTTYRITARLSFFILLLTASYSPPGVEAAVIDLTSAGASGVINGATFRQIVPQTTGTGVLDPFVQQSPQGNNTTSHAYNTTSNNTLDNKNAPNFNRSITLADVFLVTFNGVPHRRFVLDINENLGNGAEFLSLDEVQIFVGGTANSSVTSFTGAILDHDGTLVYQMDSGGDNWVALDYTLGTGSGSGDMSMLVPESVFSGFAGTDVVTLYSAFGQQGVDPTGFVGDFGGSDGFEEWSSPIPEPSTLLLGALGVAAIGLSRRRV